jgi:hypothetical protein
LASDEPAQPTDAGRLEPRLRELRTEELEGFDRVGQPFDGNLFQRGHLDPPLEQPLGVARDHDAVRSRQLLHSRRQMSGLADG